MRIACSVCSDEGFVIVRLELQSAIPMRGQLASDDARMYKIKIKGMRIPQSFVVRASVHIPNHSSVWAAEMVEYGDNLTVNQRIDDEVRGIFCTSRNSVRNSIDTHVSIENDDERAMLDVHEYITASSRPVDRSNSHR